MRIAGHNGVFKRLKGKIPGRANLAAFQNVAYLLANVQAQMFLIVEKMLIGPGIEVLLGEGGNIVLLILPLFTRLAVVIHVIAGVFDACSLT